MAALEELFANPKIAMGYGLLASRENPIGAAFGLLQQGQELQQKQSDNAIRNKLLDRQMRGLDIEEQKAQREAEMNQRIMDTLAQGGDMSALAPYFVVNDNAAGLSYINDMKAKQETEASFNGSGALTQSPSYDAPMEQPSAAIPSAFDSDLSSVGQDAPMNAPAVEPLQPIAGMDTVNTPDTILQQLGAERNSPSSLTAGGQARIKQLEALYDRAVKIEEQRIKKEGEANVAPTESQANSANFATRMFEAENILTPLEAQGISTANVGERAVGALPVVGNYLTSPEYKQYGQAQEDWVRAKLRKESGAVIGEEEMAREIITYFPKIGDDPATIEQKRKARDTALSGVAGGAKKDFKLPEAQNINVDMQKQAIEILRQRGAI